MSGLAKLRELSTEALADVVASSQNKRDVLRKLNLFEGDARVRSLLAHRCQQEGISMDHFGGHGMRTSVSAVREAVAASSSATEVLRRLDLIDHGNSSKWLKGVCRRHGINTDHFTGRSSAPRVSVPVYVENSAFNRSSLSQRVKKDGWLPYRCSSCGNEGSWAGKELRLQLDHINGVNNDNRKENLRWLCPNCHSQTETFGSKSRK